LWQGGVFRTTNDGESWLRLGSGLSSSDIKTLAANSGFLFAGTDGGAYRIVAATETSWTRVSQGLTGSFIKAIVAMPTGTLLAGTNAGIFASSNNGDQWRPFGLAGVSINGIATISNLITVISYYSGVFRSSDNGMTWSNLGLGNSSLQSVSLTRRGKTLVGTYNRGLFETVNGTSWTQIGPPSVNAFCLARGPQGDVWVGSDGGRVFRTTDNGRSWSLVADSVARQPLHNYIQTILVTSASTIFVGGRTFWPHRSTNRGISWTQINSGLTNGAVEVLTTDLTGNILAGTQGGLFRSTNQGESWQLLGLADKFINAILITPDGKMFVGTSWHGAFRSSDNGSTWQPINVGFTSDIVLSLALGNGGSLFAGTSTAGVFRSTNSGDIWQYVGLQGSYVQDIETNRDGHVFAVAPLSGVFRSTNNGETWEQISSGLTDTYCNDLTFGQDGFAFVGTRSSGVFGSIVRTTSVVSGFYPQRFSLYQNYPNPFNPTTRIDYSIPKTSHVSLKVFDLLGRVVATLVDEVQGLGFKSVEFDANGLTSGVYFYRLTAGSFFETKKLTLIR